MIASETVIGIDEERDLYATFRPATGTLTLASCTVSLYDSGGAAAGDPVVSGAAATGITSLASAAPQAWYTFKATTLALVPGLYRLAFRSVDSNSRKRKETLWVNVLRAYE
jgi:hypothetical protein